MSTVTTTRPINILQLGDELGTSELSVLDRGEDRDVTCHDDAFTEAQLQAAVDAHVPAPPPQTAEAWLKEQIYAIQDWLLFGDM